MDKIFICSQGINQSSLLTDVKYSQRIKTHNQIANVTCIAGVPIKRRESMMISLICFVISFSNKFKAFYLPIFFDFILSYIY